MTREYLDENYTVSSYNEDTKEQLDYYINEKDCSVGGIAYLYSHVDRQLTKMQIIKIICRSKNPDYYDSLTATDTLLDGEVKYGADTSAEFITEKDSHLVWFRYCM